jgi:hypothetical protein
LKITFEQSGGFAGLRFSTVIDTDELPSGKGRQLIQMVEAADFFNLPARIVSPRPQPDRFQYKLMIREDGRQHSVTVSEEAMPVSLGPLVKWLAEAAKQGK